jgi:hypothetical protein
MLRYLQTRMALDCSPTFGKRSVSERISCKDYLLEGYLVFGEMVSGSGWYSSTAY